MENIVGIVVGFALTTLAGGWWAARLQERSWVRQNDVRLREAENERAGAACQDLTLLLDRRLYRMQRLLWAADGSTDEGEIERRRAEYLDVLFAWNDHLNTNLSVVGSYFGDAARAYLDRLYEDFKRVGQGVETVVRAARAGEDATGISKHVALEFEGREAGSLNDRVYQFGLMLWPIHLTGVALVRGSPGLLAAGVPGSVDGRVPWGLGGLPRQSASVRNQAWTSPAGPRVVHARTRTTHHPGLLLRLDG